MFVRAVLGLRQRDLDLLALRKDSLRLLPANSVDPVGLEGAANLLLDLAVGHDLVPGCGLGGVERLVHGLGPDVLVERLGDVSAKPEFDLGRWRFARSGHIWSSICGLGLLLEKFLAKKVAHLVRPVMKAGVNGLLGRRFERLFARVVQPGRLGDVLDLLFHPRVPNLAFFLLGLVDELLELGLELRVKEGSSAARRPLQVGERSIRDDEARAQAAHRTATASAIRAAPEKGRAALIFQPLFSRGGRSRSRVPT